MAWHLFSSLAEDGTWTNHDPAFMPAERAPRGQVEYSQDGAWAEEYEAGELKRVYVWLLGPVPDPPWKRAAENRKQLPSARKKRGEARAA